jgi:hypothetical protein
MDRTGFKDLDIWVEPSTDSAARLMDALRVTAPIRLTTAKRPSGATSKERHPMFSRRD